MGSYRDWVVETSSTTGTGPYNLSGEPPAGTSYFTFRQRYANGEDDVVYWVVNADRTKWEKNQRATLTYGTPDTLTRNVVESTNGDVAVSWVTGDLPLRIYVVADADAQEIAVSGGAAAGTRPGVMRDAAVWADIADGWSDRVPFAINPAGTERPVGAYEGSVGLYLPSQSVATLAAGAANHTVVAANAGWLITLDNSAATRSVILPSLASMQPGFPVTIYGLSHNFYLTIDPDGTDAIDLGANGANLLLPGRCMIKIWKDVATGKWQTDFDYSVDHIFQRTVPSSVASVTMQIPSWANHAHVLLDPILPAADSVQLRATVLDSGGAELTTNIYHYVSIDGYDNAGLVAVGTNGTPVGFMPVAPVADVRNNTTSGGMYIDFRMSDLQSARHKQARWDLSYTNGAQTAVRFIGGSYVGTTSIITGIKFAFNSGNVATGRLTMNVRA